MRGEHKSRLANPRADGEAAELVAVTAGPRSKDESRPLFGSFQELGFSFGWHDFNTLEELDWARLFHASSLGICLNLRGSATLGCAQQAVQLSDCTCCFYYHGDPPLTASRAAQEHHRFITVEFAPAFLERHVRADAEGLHPLVRALLRREPQASAIAPPERLLTPVHQLVEGLRHCPVHQLAREVWFRCKALELVSHLLFRPREGEFLCTRSQRTARDRVDRARGILRDRLQDPPSLQELGRLVGCSPYYLSRLFSQVAGMTIQQFLRRIRMERAAELLRTGKCNVTETALEVGYNSLSHFSTTFHETYGCCPGLYPLKTPTQRNVEPMEVIPSVHRVGGA